MKSYTQVRLNNINLINYFLYEPFKIMVNIIVQNFT